MNEEIFRKKSLDKLKSPESLNDYIRVTTPGVWLLLAAVVLLLVGVVLWGVFGHIETTVGGDIHVKDGEAFCYVLPDDIDRVKAGAAVRCGDAVGTITEVLDADCCVRVDIELSDGHYDAEIILESINPMSFVIN